MGRYKEPDSRRSRAEARKNQVLEMVQGKPVAVPTPSAPVCDGNLPSRVQEIYAAFVADAMSAKVPIKQVDHTAFTRAAWCQYSMELAESIMQDTRASSESVIGAMKAIDTADRRLQGWAKSLGLTPESRARLGAKPEPEKRGGALADLLARRQSRAV